MPDVSEALEEAALVPAQVRTDGTGWSSVLASPEWWRWAASSPDWPSIAEEIARAGEQSARPGLCRVVGAQTRRPCKIKTHLEPCPHHGAGNEANRCGEPTKKGDPCRWNLVVNGACPSHPISWERLQQQQAAEAEAAARRRAHQRAEEETRAQTLLCPYCGAQPGHPCTTPHGEERETHTARRKFLTHVLLAEAGPCSSCGAPAGTLCRTSSGKDASEAHAARRRVYVPPQRLGEEE